MASAPTFLTKAERTVTTPTSPTPGRPPVLRCGATGAITRSVMPERATAAILGHFEATGLRPRFLEDLRAMGIEFPGKYFEPGKRQD